MVTSRWLSRRLGLEDLGDLLTGADRAGTTVSAAMTASVASTVATSNSGDGEGAPSTAALYRPMPSGMPTMAPGSADEHLRDDEARGDLRDTRAERAHECRRTSRVDARSPMW